MGSDDLVAVGKVGKAHGLQGEVAVEAWSDDPDSRFAVGAVLFRGDAPPVTIESVRRHGERWLIRFAETGDRTAAELLRGAVLFMAARDRPALDDPDEFYDSDLVGLRALDPVGGSIGTVVDVVHSVAGTHLVLAIPVDQGGVADGQQTREQLVPFVAALVPTVDLPGSTVVIDAPAGLFEL